MGFNRSRSPVHSVDVDVVLIPFSFIINGTSNPTLATNVGDMIQGQQVTRNSAGSFSFALTNSSAVILGAIPGGIFGASGDIVPQFTACDPVGNAANSITIKTLTGAVATDPANGSTVSGLLIVKTNTRRASR